MWSAVTYHERRPGIVPYRTLRRQVSVLPQRSGQSYTAHPGICAVLRLRITARATSMQMSATTIVTNGVPGKFAIALYGV